MFFVLYGNNREAINKRCESIVSDFGKKNKEGEVLRFSADYFQADGFFPLLDGGDLFGKPKLVIADGLLSAGLLEFGKLEALKNSPSVFVLREEKLLAEDLKKISKYSEKPPEEFKVSFKRPEFNVFTLASALGERDRKKLWVLLQEAWREGLSSENILGTLFWQAKTIAQAARAEDSDLKDFPKQNARRYARNFKEGEPEKLLQELSGMYHRRGEFGEDLDLALEKFVLSV